MTEKKVAIVQSSYIPWKGYFDIINSVNEFILFDNVQFTRRDWRNRNKIKTPNGTQWLTIPVDVKGKYHQSICETKIKNPEWKIKHWATIRHNYRRAKYFNTYKDFFETLFLDRDEKYLSNINYHFIVNINKLMGIQTKISHSMTYSLVGEKTEQLLKICKEAGATHYISGPAAKNYLDVKLFREENIAVEWMEYSGYPEYRQLFPPFEHSVSIIDLIFNEGRHAPLYMKSFGLD